VTIELHWSLAPRRYILSFDPAPIWQRAVTTVFAGSSIQCLSQEDTFLCLAAHATKHCWCSLKWICDLAQLIRSSPLDWDRIRHHAAREGMLRLTLLAVYLTAEFLHTDAPVYLLAEARADRSIPPLARAVRNYFSLGEPPPLQAKLFHLRAKERLSDKLRYLALHAAIPAGVELRYAPLPHRLSFLYQLARPFWISWTFVAHAFRLLTRRK
jgi:hypothetical protein